MSKLFYQEPEVYHAELGRVSKTALDRLDLSPAHYQAWLNREEDKPTPAMIFGGAYHCMALEPNLYAKLYAVIPNDTPSKLSKDGKQWWADFEKANEGKQFIAEGDELKLTAMVKALRVHSRVKPLLDGALLEYSCYSTLFGVDVKCKPDILRPDLGVIADLKSVINGTEGAFSKAIANYRYHVQAGFYMDAVNVVSDKYRDFLFVTQEKAEPYAVKVYRATEDMLRMGRIEYMANLETYRECVKRNEWPGYAEEIEYIDLPRWYYTRKESD